MTDDFGGQNGENLPGYTTTNVRLEWNGIAESGFDMAVYVRNLFGERFFTSPAVLLANFPKIGRAPVRERVCQYVEIPVVAVSLKKKSLNVKLVFESTHKK